MTLAGKIQDRLRVFVLDSGQWSAVDVRNVVLLLARRMRTECQANPVDRFTYGDWGRIVSNEVIDLLIMLGKEHPFLRKGQNKYRIVWHIIPVDKVIKDKIIDLEREHTADNLDIPFEILTQSG